MIKSKLSTFLIFFFIFIKFTAYSFQVDFPLSDCPYDFICDEPIEPDAPIGNDFLGLLMFFTVSVFLLIRFKHNKWSKFEPRTYQD